MKNILFVTLVFVVLVVTQSANAANAPFPAMLCQDSQDGFAVKVDKVGDQATIYSNGQLIGMLTCEKPEGPQTILQCSSVKNDMGRILVDIESGGSEGATVAHLFQQAGNGSQDRGSLNCKVTKF
jgi:hypothetical protein